MSFHFLKTIVVDCLHLLFQDISASVIYIDFHFIFFVQTDLTCLFLHSRYQIFFYLSNLANFCFDPADFLCFIFRLFVFFAEISFNYWNWVCRRCVWNLFLPSFKLTIAINIFFFQLQSAFIYLEFIIIIIHVHSIHMLLNY